MSYTIEQRDRCPRGAFRASGIAMLGLRLRRLPCLVLWRLRGRLGLGGQFTHAPVRVGHRRLALEDCRAVLVAGVVGRHLVHRGRPEVRRDEARLVRLCRQRPRARTHPAFLSRGGTKDGASPARSLVPFQTVSKPGAGLLPADANTHRELSVAPE